MNASDHLMGDLARQIFKDNYAKTPLGASAAERAELDGELWATIIESGFETALAADEGVTLREAASVLHSAGYYAARVPLAEAMLAHWLAARAGWSEETAIPILALGILVPEPVFEGQNVACRVTGVVEGVPWGRHATAIYVLAGGHIVRLAVPVARVEHAENLAGEPRDVVAFEDAAAKRSDQEIDVDEVLARAALLRAALMVGAMERALDLALDHAATRVQFGKPIGKFQAVQQLLAQLGGHVAAAAAAVDFGADHATAFAAAVAKSRAGEAAGLAAEIAHQIVAAMGFTLEHPLQLVTRRLWSWRDECGNETYWNRRIGAATVAAGGDGLWPMLTRAASIPEATVR